MWLFSRDASTGARVSERFFNCSAVKDVFSALRAVPHVRFRSLGKRVPFLRADHLYAHRAVSDCAFGFHLAANAAAPHRRMTKSGVRCRGLAEPRFPTRVYGHGLTELPLFIVQRNCRPVTGDSRVPPRPRLAPRGSCPSNPLAPSFGIGGKILLLFRRPNGELI